jgi:hypothetical protein
MDTLPNEIKLLIFDCIYNIKDKRNFTRTCKTYQTITKDKMRKIKYIIFKSEYDSGGVIIYNFWCICDTLIDFRQCLTKYLHEQYIKTHTTHFKKEYVIIKRSKEKLRGSDLIFEHQFIIEDTIINNVT